MKYNKENLFISGYNDELVNVGDFGIFGESVLYIKMRLKYQNIFKCRLIWKDQNGIFIGKNGIKQQMFYRLKKAPEKK
jgi:hypothetical protein